VRRRLSFPLLTLLTHLLNRGWLPASVRLWITTVAPGRCKLTLTGAFAVLIIVAGWPSAYRIRTSVPPSYLTGLTFARNINLMESREYPEFRWWASIPRHKLVTMPNQSFMASYVFALSTNSVDVSLISPCLCLSLHVLDPNQTGCLSERSEVLDDTALAASRAISRWDYSRFEMEIKRLSPHQVD
jgi:hypothetical protein